MMSKAIAATRASQWVGTRGRRILHTGSWSMIAKATAAANLFLTIPFVLEALGPSQFGIWATLASLVTFAGFLDFGLGNGTMNLVASAHGRGEERRIGTIVHEGRRALALIALLLGAIALVAVPLTPWHRLLGVPEAMSFPVRVSVGIVMAAIVLAVPLNLATRVQLGMGQGNHAFRWQAIGQALTACLVIVLASAHAGLELLVAATVATPLLASIANNVQLSRNTLLAQRAVKTRDPSVAAAIRNEGVLFFVLQLAAALAFSADLPLISALRSPEEAGQYAIVQRLFSIVPMALGLVWIPLWPLYRQALAAGDHRWVTRTLRTSVVTASSVGLFGALMIALSTSWIIRQWLPAYAVPTVLLLASFVIWTTLDVTGTAVSTFLNAASEIKYQIIVATIFSTFCLLGKIATLKAADASLLPLITSTAYAATFLVPTAFIFPRLLDRALARNY